MTRPQRTLKRGFTLIELAIAMTIVSLVLGGLSVPMSKRVTEQQYTETQIAINQAMDALVGFAALNGRLPCPDMDTAAGTTDNRDGIEDTATVVLTNGGVSQTFIQGCSIGVAGTTSAMLNYHSDPQGASWGDLPWKTLGLAPPNHADAWGNRLRYAVFTPITTTAGTVGICNNLAGIANIGCKLPLSGVAGTTPLAQLDIRCNNPNAGQTPTATAPGCLTNILTTPNLLSSVTTDAVFVVYSMGANGWGATSINATASQAFQNPSAFEQTPNAPELNSNTVALRRQYITRDRTDANSTSGDYDDVMSYMTSNSLAAKLLHAGIWPPLL